MNKGYPNQKRPDHDQYNSPLAQLVHSLCISVALLAALRGRTTPWKTRRARLGASGTSSQDLDYGCNNGVVSGQP